MTPQLLRALEWIMRLPLLGDLELASLLGVDEVDARHLREELDRRGWVEWIAPRVAGLNERPMAFIRPDAVPALAELLGTSAEALARRAPVRHADVLHRIPRVEIFAGVHRLFADLATSVRLSDRAELVDACTLPLALRVTERWWPAGVHGYGCLRSSSGWAPFFVVWDRAGATDVQRRQRVRDWFTHRGDAIAMCEAAPVSLVVAAGERELHMWEEALLRRMDQANEACVDVALATARELLRAGADGVIWRNPGVEERTRVVRQLRWPSRPLVSPLSFRGVAALGKTAHRRPPLREGLRRAVVACDEITLRERVAALALATDREDKLLLEWIARHPRLTKRQLAIILDRPEPSISRRLTRLVQAHAVRVVSIPRDSEDTLETTRTARALLAAASDLSQDQYERHGGARPARDVRYDRELDHRLGVNRAFTILAVVAPALGRDLALWRNEAESAQRFTDGSRRYFIRPDGSGILRGDSDLPFLLEYDRGTLDAGDYSKKFVGYRSYYETGAWQGQFVGEPILLFVCADDRAARRVAEAARVEAQDLPLLITAEWRLTAAESAAALLAPIGKSRQDRRRYEVVTLHR